MNDDQIGEVLRKTLAARAATVTQGPAWDEDDEPLEIAPRRYRRARWLAPLAAAAVVLAVVGAVFAVRGNDEPNQPAVPGAAGQVAVPHGMKAVDALGVEIFVPSDFAVDDNCSQRSVARPIPARIGSCDGVPNGGASLHITISPVLTTSGRACGSVTVTLEREPACVTEQSVGTQSQLQVSWPRAAVTITAVGRDEKGALQILRSAHAVPVDRNGCRATNTDLDRALPRNIPDPANIQLHGLPLPTSGLDRMSVCWYISNRLAASAQVGGAGGRHIAQTVNALLPKWPAPQPQPNLPSCDQVDRHDGVQLIAHTRAGDVEAIAQLAACNGQRTVNAGSRAVLVEPELAAALARATGIPFADGYPAN